ncbi:MAG: hypothetical protein HC866_01895 [Leptolyngbyaceae cyanobacterium RU_5_1]|nr:hypothetical protein [Leptolyngbyaceae cyanobacterium RU_5_1]
MNLQLFPKRFLSVRFHPVQLLVLLVGIAIVGCNSLAVSETGKSTAPTPTGPPTVAIQEIQNNSISGSTVYLKGLVGDRVPILGGMVYQLQDTTGTIWVLTTGQAPPQAQEVVIKGIPRFKSIPLNGKEHGSVYVEQQE